MLGGSDGPSQPKRLINATEYQCENGKRFYVRLENNGGTAWVIYPDREVALAKQADATRYSNGVALLEINGGTASLKDDSLVYGACQAVGGKQN
jgi:membrane-bound inhibitor of C-type lysozyme